MTKNKHDSFMSQFLLTTIGSIPTIGICVVCAYMFQQDYANNRFNFFEQPTLYGSIDKSEFYQNVTCDTNDYSNDKINFKTCAPKNCARYFTDKVISDNEANVLLEMSKKAFSNSKADESSLYYDFHTNKVLTQQTFEKYDKKMLADKSKKSFSSNDLKVKSEVVNKILEDVKKRFEIEDLYPTYPQFFHKMTLTSTKNHIPKSQIDKKINDAFHYTATLYLNDHQLNYYGGRFVIDDQNKSTFLSIEPKKARVIVYSAGSENKNQIEELKEGDRIVPSKNRPEKYSFTIYFTCNKQLATKS